MKVQLKKLSQKDIEERKANYDVFVEVKEKKMKGLKTKKANWNFNFKFPMILFSVPTAFIGHHIHGSLFWAIMDLIFWPIAWLKWFIYHEVTLSIIKETFSWFFV